MPHAKGFALKGDERVQLVKWGHFDDQEEWMLQNAKMIEEQYTSATFSITEETLERLAEAAGDFVDRKIWDPKEYHYFWYHDSDPAKTDRFIFLARKYIKMGYTIEYVSFW